MTQAETIAIRKAIAHLEREANASPQTLAALNNPQLRSYLDTWVIARLRLLLPESRNTKLAASL